MIKDEKKEVFFVGHGFGGSSLMNFAVIDPLLKKGDVILWEIRGMGVSQKLDNYAISTLEGLEQFFLQTVTVLLNHFKPINCTFICHSFSGYLVLRYLLKFPELIKHHVKEVILLSTVGITPKEEDYKYNPSGCGDCIYATLIKLGWALKLNYQTMLKNICCCFKTTLVNSNFLQGVELD